MAYNNVLGIRIEKVDRLSRQLDLKVKVEKNNDNQIFVKNYWLCSLLKVVMEEPKVDILEKIKIVRSKNEEVVRVVEEMKKAKVKVLRGEEWQVEEDLVLKEEKVYISNNEALKVEIIWLHHNVPITRHRKK